MFCLINTRIISVKIGLFLQEITFTTEFPGSNFLLPTFITGGKWDFQVANLLLATVNFEPRKYRLFRVFAIAHVVGLCYHAIAHLNYYFCKFKKFKEIFKTAYFCKLLLQEIQCFFFLFFFLNVLFLFLQYKLFGLIKAVCVLQ